MSHARHSSQTRADAGLMVRAALSNAGLSVAQAGKLFQVTPRTVRNWCAGRTRPPGAVIRLLRMMARFELPAPFDGWCLHSGKLWTPEGHGIEPRDGAWWSLLVRQARGFRVLYQRMTAMEAVMRRAADPHRASEALHVCGSAAGQSGSLSTMRKTERVKSPLVITGITSGVSQSEIEEIRL